jgi:hypothetical protein
LLISDNVVIGKQVEPSLRQAGSTDTILRDGAFPFEASIQLVS